MGSFDGRKSTNIKMEHTTWLSILIAIVTLATPVLSSSPRVVCYYTNWSVYRPGTAKFNPQNINPYLCTHLVYAFGGFTKDNTLKPFDKYQDIEKGGYAKFTGLKTYNKNLKTLLAIGGWNEGSSRFSPMVAAKDRRKEFVRNAIKFLRQNHFDGLDLDWEYPAFRDGGKPKDRENYARLVKELREEFERESEKTGKPRLLLTMAVPAGIEYIQKGFDVKTLNRYLDWMNLLTYDYHSAFEPAVNHHAPLYPLEEPNEYSVDNELNIDYTIKFYLENGADPDKLVLGIPTYGRSYTLFNSDAVEIGSPADGPGEQGDATREKGYLAYYEICEALKPKSRKRAIASEEYSEEDSEEEEEIEEEWTIMYPNKKAMGPVAYKGNQWVGYDDVEIVKKKAEYVAENGLGGIMFWSIDNDDFRGTCHGKPYPLIEAAKESYIMKLGSTEITVEKESEPIAKAKSSSSRRKNRPRPSSTTTTTTTTTTAKPKIKSNKRKSSTTVSTTPAWNIITPEPPTTPDPGSDFKCKDEGFFPHPRDCKKYFWCLDSGPSDLGIVAHQFTCPSGLYFNKAADSCDFARNVLCKKATATTKAPTKPTTAKTTVTTTTPTTTTTTTTRRPIRLTSRSSLLFRTSTTTTTTTTTTPEPELSEEEEEEVAEEVADVEAEDPKVIKELIDLIKKVGGVEQLEKQLKLSETSSSSGTTGGASTTPSSFNKKLYQKVLERTRGKNRFGTNSGTESKSSNSITEGSVQNSRRGPQNEGLEATPDKNRLLRKERPQYVTINRSRTTSSTTPLSVDSEEEEEEESSEEDIQVPRSREIPRQQSTSLGSTAKPLQYVNIRRSRPTTAGTEAPDVSRNALFERVEPFVAVAESPNSLDIASARRENIPEYVTIRRSRPTTEATTVQYQSSEEEEDKESQESVLEREITSQSNEPQYNSILRARATLPPEPELSSPEPTTVLSVQISSLLNEPNSGNESPEPEPAIQTTEAETTTTSTTVTTLSSTTQTTSASSTRRPLIRRRGSTIQTTSTEAPTTSTQVSSRNYSFIRRRRPLSQPNEISESNESVESSRKIRSTTPDSREIGGVRASDNSGVVKRFRSKFRISRVEDSVPAAASQVSRGQLRPQFNSDEVSLTPVEAETSEIINFYDEDVESNERFLGRVSTVADKAIDSEVSATTIDERRPNNLPRGRGRFSTFTTVAISKTTNSPVDKRRPTLARFSPRPFARSTITVAKTESNINGENTSVSPRARPRLTFGRSRNVVSTSSPILQARKLPFTQSQSTTQSSLALENDDDELDDKNDDINLSESAIAVKEHNEEEADEKKQNISDEIIESIPSSEASSERNGKKKFRVIRRRPTISTTEAFIPEIIETTTPSVTRIRKIIRKKIKTHEEESDITTKLIGLVNAGFKDAPKDLINYGEKTRTTTTVIPTEEYITSTEKENDKEIIIPVTEILKETTANLIMQKDIIGNSNINDNENKEEENKSNISTLSESEEKQENVDVIVKTDGILLSGTDIEPKNDRSKEEKYPENNENADTDLRTNVKTVQIGVEEENLLPENNTSGMSVASSSEEQGANTSKEESSTEISGTETEIMIETTTTSTTQLIASSPSPRSRSPYRPPKRLFTSTTESTPSSSRTFSRKYNPGAYTSPATVERPGIFSRGTTKRPLFSRTFTRRTYPPARTTPRQPVDEEEEYSDEEILEEEPENPSSFVPPNKLFTRRPDSEEYEDLDVEEEVGNEDEEEIPEEEIYEEDERPVRFKPTSKKPSFKPRVVNSNTLRTSTSTTEIPRQSFVNSQNKTITYNRFSGNKVVNDTKKRVQNVPIGYNILKSSLNGSSKNSTKQLKNNETKELESNTTVVPISKINDESTTQDDDYLSMSEVTSTVSSDISNDAISTGVDEIQTITTEMEIDNSTDDYLEYTTYPNTQDLTVNLQTEIDTATEAVTVTANTTKIENISEDITEVWQETTTASIAPVSPIVKTQFNKLFSISRVVEVSSKSEKHRLNKNNETTLIEEGKIKVEKKPTVDKIGEVSRFSLIKIVEDEIPIYLTKYGHIYPVENPPHNPIRIDEARNARALVDYSDIPKENLIASESMNEAYRHINRLPSPTKQTDKGQIEHIPNDDFLSYINDDKKNNKSGDDESYPQWQFIPAAYENEKSNKNGAINNFNTAAPHAILTNPSTLPLEALFKTENPLPRKVKEIKDDKPFVVYSAPVPTQEEEASFVKLKILIPQTARKIVTFAKGREFQGPPVDETTVRQAISVSILEQSPKSVKESSIPTTQSVVEIASSTTELPSTVTSPTENIMSISPIVDLLTMITVSTSQKQSEIVQTTELPATQTTTEISTTETATEETTTVKISPIDAKRAKYGLGRRPIIKASNLTRFASPQRIVPKITITPRPIQKLNRTSSFSPNKSRFSANRAQNVPVDVRKKSTTKLSRTFTTESPKTTTERRVFRPARPVRPSFFPKRLTTFPPTVAET